MQSVALAPFHRAHLAGPSYWGPGDTYTFLVTGEESGGAYFSMLATVPPGAARRPTSTSTRTRRSTSWRGPAPSASATSASNAGPGDFVNVPRGVVHCFRNFTDEPMKMILTFTPAGIEKFFEETLERALDLTQDPPDNIDEVGARYAEAAPRYGMEFFLDDSTA